LLVYTATPARADDPGTLADRLAQLQQQQSLQQQHLAALEAQRAQLQQTLLGLQAELADTGAALAPIAAQAQALENELNLKQDQLGRDEAAYRIHRQAFHTDVRRVYAMGSLHWLDFLASSRSFADLLDRILYLDQFAVAEFHMASRLQAERTALEGERTILAQERAALDPLLQELQARVAAVSQQLDATAAYDSQLEAAHRQTLIALAGLRATGRALQTALDQYQAQQMQMALKNPGATYGVTCPPAAPVGSVRFCGHGWGHGVGMGQWGAYGMALAGNDYRAILQHFYTGTTFATVDTTHTPIHVAVLWGAGPDRIVATGPVQVAGPSGSRVAQAGETIAVAVSSGLVRITPLSPDTRLTLYGPFGRYHAYRGSLVAQPSGGLLYIINTLSIEDYLRGLAEVPSTWRLDAIKAQIVAARCYALTHLGTTALYDVDDTTQFQVYRGIDSESDQQNQAVDGTTGQVLLSDGRVIIAFFSASDGGHTANVWDIWGGSGTAYPYLVGVLDPWDVVAPRHTWYTGVYPYGTLERVYFSGADVATYGHLVNLDLSDRDPSDRLNTVGLIGSRGTKRIGVGAFLRAFNDSPLTGTDVLWNEMFGATPSPTWRYW
jgi:peptidoglycan hydrolase-like amidase